MVSPEFDPSSADAGFYGVNLLEMIDDEQITRVARETRDAGVWIVPTNTMIANVALASPTAKELSARPQMAYLPSDLVQGWVQSKQGRVGTINRVPDDGRRLVELRNRIVRIMHEEGVGLLLGSDAPQFFNVPGFSLHNELAYMVDAGLSPYEALYMGTSSGVSPWVWRPTWCCWRTTRWKTWAPQAGRWASWCGESGSTGMRWTRVWQR